MMIMLLGDGQMHVFQEGAVPATMYINNFWAPVYY